MNHMSRASREAMITALAGLVDPLKRSLIGSSEVVLHDLSKMPNSIVAISGHLTSRNIGDPATEALLRAWRERNYADPDRLRKHVPRRAGPALFHHPHRGR